MDSEEYLYNLQGRGFSRLSVSELKELLRERKLPLSGTRKELILRLRENGVPEPGQLCSFFLCLDLKPSELEASNKAVTRHRDFNLDLGYVANLFEKTTSLGLYTEFYKMLQIPSVVRRRHTAIYGETNLQYTVDFSNDSVVRTTIPWENEPLLCRVRDIVSEVTGASYSYCILQYYPSGKSNINPHRDKELTPGSVIAGLSLGQERTLRLNNYSDRTYDIPLPSGSLYVLYPPSNDFYTHSILKDVSQEGRISLTFRYLK